MSGLLAHPRLFRDAFSLRLRASRQLREADIHNRLSVWASPSALGIGGALAAAALWLAAGSARRLGRLARRRGDVVASR